MEGVEERGRQRRGREARQRGRERQCRVGEIGCRVGERPEPRGRLRSVTLKSKVSSGTTRLIEFYLPGTLNEWVDQVPEGILIGRDLGRCGRLVHGGLILQARMARRAGMLRLSLDGSSHPWPVACRSEGRVALGRR
jgi:hypothetical protein